MKTEEMDNIVFLAIIAGRKQRNALLMALGEVGVRLARTTYGKGTVNASYLQNLLGLVPEEKKTVITCVTTREKSDAAMEMLINKFSFDKPNTGVAFTVPVERLSF